MADKPRSKATHTEPETVEAETPTDAPETAPKATEAVEETPRNMTDKEAAAAFVAAEGKGEDTVDIWHNGLCFTVPTDMNDWPAAVIYLLEQGSDLTGIRRLIGPAMFDAYMATDPTVGDVKKLSAKMTAGMGGQGN